MPKPEAPVKPYVTCRLTPREALPCGTMEQRLTDGHKAGFFVLVLFNMKTEKDVVKGIAYKQNARDNGLMLNYCPWCGTKLMEDGKPVYLEETTAV